MICSTCGMELDGNANRRFCEHCGAMTMLNPIPTPAHPSDSSIKPPLQEKEQPRTNNEKKVENSIRFLKIPGDSEGKELASTLAPIPPRPEEIKPKKDTKQQKKPVHVLAEATLDQIGVDAPDDKIEDVKIIVSSISQQFKKKNDLKAFMKKVFF